MPRLAVSLAFALTCASPAVALADLILDEDGVDPEHPNNPEVLPAEGETSSCAVEHGARDVVLAVASLALLASGLGLRRRPTAAARAPRPRPRRAGSPAASPCP